MSGQPFLSLIIHPQTGSCCYSDRLLNGWPGDFTFPSEHVRIWPVPRIREARLVDCHCGKTGIQPQTLEAAARYLPGTDLVEENGQVRLVMSPNPSFQYPTGSGEDEDESQALLPGIG